MRAVSIPVQPSAIPGWLTPVEQQALYALRENLARLALERLVEISVGDFSGVPRLGYNFIFSDCMHTPHEIAAGLPTLRSILNGRGCILAAHDWSPENEAFLRRNLPIADAARFDSLFVCQVSEAA